MNFFSDVICWIQSFGFFFFFINKMFYIFTKTNNLLSEKMKTNYNYPSSETRNKGRVQIRDQKSDKI